MKILICPDKFKESLSASNVADHIRIGIIKALPDAECKCIPMADGGEGTVEALVSATSGKIVKAEVHDPFMRPIQSFFGISADGKTAYIEMAAASGLALIPKDERNPLVATSFGTGELILHALNYKCDAIIIGMGGSATVDCGTGMARALGVKFIGASGKETANGGGYLRDIQKIDCSGIDRRLAKCKIYAASDVRNVLHGPEGAAFVFGQQKGAAIEQLKILDQGLKHLGRLIKEELDIEVSEVPGGGAAGGLGAGIIAFLRGEIKNGFNLIADQAGLKDWINWADIIVTGEGKSDYQTSFGKTPAGVAKLALKMNKPVISFAGALGNGYNRLYDEGFLTLVPIADGPITLEESIARTPELLEAAAERIFRIFTRF